MPHFLKLFLALQLGMSEDRVRAIAPDVGGGFGSKLQIYGEEILLALGVAHGSTGRSSGSRRARENMIAAHHGRDQVAYVKIGAKPRRHVHRPARRRSSRTSART